ncbi:Uncharacterized RNA-binding protein C365.04c [Eumeta japonica]|uniref:Uncharacterized RNA-binding protein C365.04c n=1 Tax=Eumeta variegata TaxID=151549 RepID=A0A4C1XNE2_EUMVA|nr:Uncharacterized RNA-binding protein C365.04c [Eumeta japonica]
MDLNRKILCDNFITIFGVDYSKTVIDQLTSTLGTKTTVYQWFSEFSRGRSMLTNEFKEGRPKSSRIKNTSSLPNGLLPSRTDPLEEAPSGHKGERSGRAYGVKRGKHLEDICADRDIESPMDFCKFSHPELRFESIEDLDPTMMDRLTIDGPHIYTDGNGTEGKVASRDIQDIVTHAGTMGNERADELARNAALKKKMVADYDRFSLSFAKKAIRAASLEEWQKRYVEGNTETEVGTGVITLRESFSHFREGHNRKIFLTFKEVVRKSSAMNGSTLNRGRWLRLDIETAREECCGEAMTRAVTQTTLGHLARNLHERAIVFFKTVFNVSHIRWRIRQLLRDSFTGTPEHKMPEVLNKKIEWIINNSQNPDLLTDAELRKIKILYNMLKTWQKKLELKSEEITGGKEKIKKQGKKKGKPLEGMAGDHIDWSKAIGKRVDAAKDEQKKEDYQKKEKELKPKHKRYVVFVGNLPNAVDKLQIMQHFAEFSDNIKSVRIPKTKDGESHSFAYVEFDDEPSFEYALSRNHTMMGNRRINVEYTTHKNSKVSKSEAKGKAAKLSALQRSGVLLGSVPLSRKRSARRKKMREAKSQCSDLPTKKKS